MLAACMVLFSIILYCLVSLVSFGIVWYCLVMFGIVWCYLVLFGIVGHSLILFGIVGLTDWNCQLPDVGGNRLAFSGITHPTYHHQWKRQQKTIKGAKEEFLQFKKTSPNFVGHYSDICFKVKYALKSKIHLPMTADKLDPKFRLKGKLLPNCSTTMTSLKK